MARAFPFPVSIILPALNEATTIATFIPEIDGVCKEFGLDYEIILVDDGSTDTTQQVVETLKTLPHFRSVRHETNSGYGAALQSGFRAAQKEWIFFTDADRQFDIREIQNLIANTESVDAVLGYRVDRKDNFLRLFNAWLFHLGLWALFGLNVRDIDCAFKLIRKSVLMECFPESRGAFVNAELLIKLRRKGCTFVQIPVSHYPRRAGNPTGANIRVIARAMKDIILFRLTGKVT